MVLYNLKGPCGLSSGPSALLSLCLPCRSVNARAQRTKGARPKGGPQSPHEPTIHGSGGLPRTSLRSPGDDVLRAALRGHGWHSTKELHGSAHLISGKHGLVVFIYNRTSLVRAACSEQDHTAHTRRLHETETELSC